MRHTVTVTVKSSSDIVGLTTAKSSEGFDFSCTQTTESCSSTEHARLLAMAIAGAATSHPDWCLYSVATLLMNGVLMTGRYQLRNSGSPGQPEDEVIERLLRASADLVAFWDDLCREDAVAAGRLRVDAEHGEPSDPSDNGRSKT